MKETDRQNTVTLDYLRRLAVSGFWGSITMKYENGVVVHIRKKKTSNQTRYRNFRGNMRTDHIIVDRVAEFFERFLLPRHEPNVAVTFVGGRRIC
jgi:hypothetical protein